MARYDKYDPYDGGFRVPLNVDWLAADVDTVFGVGVNGSGKIVKGAGTSGVVGVLVLTMARKAREIVDVMTDGEIVEFNVAGPARAAFAADAPGVAYYANATTGVISTTNTRIYVGHTCEAGRLVVRTGRKVA